MLGQEIGLAEVRLSRVERELGRDTEADRDMKGAQDELAALGWKNVSAEHLVALTKRLDSQYEQPSLRSKSVASISANAKHQP